MAITPQAIKDQEFQVKFRGYDTVEVKAYLELIAEEFFELLEQVRQQIDEMDIIVDERDSLAAEKKLLEEELNTSRGSSEEIQTVYAEKDTEVAELQGEVEKLKAQIASLENEIERKDNRIADAEGRLANKDRDVAAEKERISRLMDKVDELEKQNEELRGEEIDFKSTLIAAQKFTNDLKKRSEQEAREIVDRARAEAEKLRQDTYSELASYPAEIERLKKRRNKVREDLEATLRLCLENLDIFKEEEEAEDYGELFQKIKFDKDGMLDTDELDTLDMDLELTSSAPPRQESGDAFSMRDEIRKFGEDLS